MSNPAQSLRSKADALTKQIEAKMNPACGLQRPTRRRAAIADSMRRDGLRLRRVQTLLYGLAAGHDAGTLPQYLCGVRSVDATRRLLDWGGAVNDEHLIRNGVAEDDVTAVREALLIMLDARPESPEEAAKRVIQDMERELIGCKIPGFFPTPRPVVDLMLREADIQPGMEVLEPSAGKGNIAEAVVEVGARVSCYEVNHRLRQILEAKMKIGAVTAHVMGHDFMMVDPTPMFHRVLLNPPFEGGQDAEHVMRAFDFLIPGGRLVAIMSPGPFWRNDAKARKFREWLQVVEPICYALPDNSFHESGTSVATRLLIVDKGAS